MPKPPSTILLVEDEFLIRDYVADHLRDLGFAVFAVGDASQAIELLAAGAPVNLVFTDITLPGQVDGIGLAQWVREQRPTLPVILTSGGHNAARAAELGNGELFVVKPYDLEVLVEHFRRLLRSTGSP